MITEAQNFCRPPSLQEVPAADGLEQDGTRRIELRLELLEEPSQLRLPVELVIASPVFFEHHLRKSREVIFKDVKNANSSRVAHRQTIKGVLRLKPAE